MFVIMVGQQVIGRSADKRTAQTYLNAEAVLHACERLQAHLRAQDLAIRHVVEHVQQHPNRRGGTGLPAVTAPRGRGLA
jgi:hypothetical protein